MGLVWLSLVALPLINGISIGSVSLHPVEPIGREVENEPATARQEFPKRQQCAVDENWTMPTFEVTGGERLALSRKPWIVMRGATFRVSAELQERAFCSFSRHVVEPLKKAYALSSVHVHLCVRPHKDNDQIMKNAEKYFGVAMEDVSFREVSKTEQPLQTGQYKTCLDDVPNDAGFALILRPDLIFQENLNFGRAVSPDRFYFQWNLFQNCKKLEVPDQIHFIGGNMIKEFKDKWDSREYHGGTMGAAKDGQMYFDTFHMMYRWAMEAFGQERLGYLNEYPKENCHYESGLQWHLYGFCRQRVFPKPPEKLVCKPGERAGCRPPQDDLTNPLFAYDRDVSVDSAPSCEWD
jgi:hypothetical protein